MEHAQNVIVADGAFEWDDLGSWNALGRHLKADAEGNCAVADFIHVDAARNIIFDARTKGRRTPIAVVGLRDSILVQTDDATLLAHKSQAQKVKELVKEAGRGPEIEKAGLRLLANDGFEAVFESGDQFLMRGIDLGVGQASLRISVGKSVSQAFLPIRDVFSAKNIEQFDGLQICGLGLFYNLQNGIVSRWLRHDHGDISSNGGLGWQRFEGLAGVPAGQKHVQIQFGKENGVPQIVLLGEWRHELAKFAELKLAKSYRGGFEKKGCFRSRRVIFRLRIPKCSKNSSITPFRS